MHAICETGSRFFALLLLVAGCAHTPRLVPAPDAQRLAGDPEAAVASAAGVQVTVRSRAWKGNPRDLESIVTPLAQALGLRLLTPETFLDATSEGSDPTAADKASIDLQIQRRQIEVYVYNSQNATPDVQAQVTASRRNGIAIATLTETLTPAGTSFEDWQVRELRALAQALAKATGR